jgi:hypothetical protein
LAAPSLDSIDCSFLLILAAPLTSRRGLYFTISTLLSEKLLQLCFPLKSMERTFPSPYIATVYANPDKFQAGDSISFEPYNVGKQITDVIRSVRFVGYEGDDPADATLEVATLNHYIMSVIGVSHFQIIYKDGQ